MNDADLVTRCRDGDNMAWEVLIRRYQRLVFAIASRAGLPEETVESVFHETFARLAVGIATIDRRDRIHAWLVTTARRLTIDAIRARKSRRAVDDADAVLENLEDPAELRSEALERMVERHRVRQALSRVGDRCRRLLTALFYDHSDPPRSYRSIAADLGMPVGSLGPTRNRCLAKLLEEYEALEDD